MRRLRSSRSKPLREKIDRQLSLPRAANTKGVYEGKTFVKLAVLASGIDRRGVERLESFPADFAFRVRPNQRDCGRCHLRNAGCVGSSTREHVVEFRKRLPELVAQWWGRERSRYSSRDLSPT